jgi:hypothetical protein
MSLKVVQTEVHNLILNVRRLDRVINSSEFEALFSTLDVEDQAHVLLIIKNLSASQLIQWYEERLHSEVGDFSVRQLRITASRLGIARYALMDKVQLIRNIIYEQARSRNAVRESGEMESRNITATKTNACRTES